ncbi:MAG: type pilus assembly protein PilA [Solirubrobacteraceae bacterium]|nr:type pilus assembly protein PilA [Solirubrobacteraceae bacterium]
MRQPENAMRPRGRAEAWAQDGFTLIELLVTILIIATLAALAIPSFINQRDKARDVSAKALVRTAQLAEETYYTDAQTYVAGAAPLGVIEATLASVASLVAHAPSTNPFGAVAPGGAPPETAQNSFDVEVSSPTGVIFAVVRHSDGVVEHVCNVPSGTVASGCHVSGGAASGLGTW